MIQHIKLIVCVNRHYREGLTTFACKNKSTDRQDWYILPLFWNDFDFVTPPDTCRSAPHCKHFSCLAARKQKAGFILTHEWEYKNLI